MYAVSIAIALLYNTAVCATTEESCNADGIKECSGQNFSVLNGKNVKSHISPVLLGTPPFTEAQARAVYKDAACSLAAADSRWQGYLHHISSSLANYQGCGGSRCGCHGDVIDSDLAVWRERGGIQWAEFEAALKMSATSRGVHYQIIDHALYRQKECMFSTR